MLIFFQEMGDEVPPKGVTSKQREMAAPPQLYTDVRIEARNFQVMAIHYDFDYSTDGPVAWVLLKPYPVPEKPCSPVAASSASSPSTR
jgi:hypothetical protein